MSTRLVRKRSQSNDSLPRQLSRSVHRNGTEAAGQRLEAVAEKEVAVLAGRFAGLHELIAQAEVARERQGGGLGVEKAVWADLDLKVVFPESPRGAAGRDACSSIVMAASGKRS